MARYITNTRETEESTAIVPAKKRKTAYVALPAIVLQSPVDGQLLPLPVSTNMQFPHFQFLLGLENNKRGNIAINVFKDSGAGINIAHLDYITRLILMRPEIVYKIFTTKGADGQAGNFGPIKLSGIVSTDDDATTTSTELPVAYMLHTPYTQLDRTPIKLTFACGKNVTVNAIIGNPLLRDVDAVVDYGRNTMRIASWGKTFELTYQPPRCPSLWR